MELTTLQKNVLSKIGNDYGSIADISNKTGIQQASVLIQVKSLAEIGIVLFENPAEQGKSLMVKLTTPKKPLEFKGIVSHYA